MQSVKKPAVVIVDPFGSGAYLAPFFVESGWSCIAIVSSAEVPVEYTSTLRASQYELVIAMQEKGLLGTLRELEMFNVRLVIPGMETGVEAADMLRGQLQLPGNDVSLSEARRDKASMGARLMACGVPAAEQLAVSDELELIAWAKERNIWPLVVKPTRSSGSDGLAICQDINEVREAFCAIMNRTNKLGEINRVVLAQEFLLGQQYVVNTASSDGCHYVGEIWQYDSLFDGMRKISDKRYLMPSYGEIQDELVKYSHQVLEALAIRQGAAHIEIMMTPQGPRLIECAARMTGMIGQKTLLDAVGHNHITLCVESFLNPARLAARRSRYETKRSVANVALRATCDGTIASGKGFEELTSLATFSEYVPIGKGLSPGTPVRKTVDLFTCPGFIYLSGRCLEEVEADIHRVRQIEKTLYLPDETGL